MLYMEDYLEMIEHLPQELRDRFTDMREMDLSVQNSMDSLEKRVKVFFSNTKRMKQMEKDDEYSVIRKDYYKTLEDADEKVQLANQMYELVERYLRRLDQELHKFKMELEAGNKGITEVLEKRSLELDQPQTGSTSQKENRYRLKARERRESRRDSSLEEKIISSIINPIAEIRGPIQQSSVGYTLGHMGAGSNAIAAAASQAIAATQQMQQGRRTASLKASYEAIHIGVNPINEFSIGRELAASATLPHEPPRKKKKTSSSTNASAAVTSLGPTISQGSLHSSPAPLEDYSDIVDPIIEGNPDSMDFMDPNEPRYCICNQVSYGYMVACDNVGCPLEWFHYACVDIIAPPKGKWYCPQCTSSMKRRGHRKHHHQ